MNTIFKKSLDKLLSLSADALRGYCCRFRTDLGSAEWKMGLGLLALKRTGAFRELGYSTLSDFAERALNLSGRKVGQLLGAAEALEYLPVLSEAYRKGEIGWGKVRAIHGLATPETEEEWLRFAAAHGTEEVARKVALSPRNWKRHNALKASLGGKPIATADMVREVLARPLPAKERPAEETLPGADEAEGATEGSSASNTESLPVSTDTASPSPSILPCKSERSGVSAQATVTDLAPTPPTAVPIPPAHSKKVRFMVEMDADDYAVFEQAETRIRTRAGRRLRRSKVLLKMAEAVLSEGTAKDRARHQVIIHTVEDAEGGWYETDRGVLPASPEVVQQALQTGRVLRAEELIGSCAEGRRDGDSSSRDKSVDANPPGDSPESKRGQDVKANPPGDSSQNKHGQDVKTPGDSTNNDRLQSFEADPSSDSPARGQSECPDPNPQADSPSNDSPKGIGANPPGDSKKDDRLQSCETDPSSDSSAYRQSKFPNPNPPGDSSTPSADQNLVFQRKPVPNATIRKLYARAGKRCERCQTSGCRLHIHHCTPVSEGGGDNRLATLELLCSACHSLEHEKDFRQKLHWSRARDSAMLHSGTNTRARSLP